MVSSALDLLLMLLSALVVALAVPLAIGLGLQALTRRLAGSPRDPSRGVPLAPPTAAGEDGGAVLAPGTLLEAFALGLPGSAALGYWAAADGVRLAPVALPLALGSLLVLLIVGGLALRAAGRRDLLRHVPLAAVVVLLLAVGFAHWLPGPVVFDVPWLPNLERARLGIPTRLVDRGAWAYSGSMLLAAAGASPLVPIVNAGTAIGWLTAASIFGGTALAARRSAVPGVYLLCLGPLVALGRFWEFALTSKFSVSGLGLLCGALAFLFAYVHTGDRRAGLVGALLVGLGAAFGNSGLLYGGIALGALFLGSGDPFLVALAGVAGGAALAFTAGPALGPPGLLLVALAVPLLVAWGGLRLGRVARPQPRLWKLHPGWLVLGLLGLGALAALLLPTSLYPWYAPGSGLSLFTRGYGPLVFLGFGSAVLAAFWLPEREAYFLLVVIACPVLAQMLVLVVARLLPLDLAFEGAILRQILYETSRITTLYVFPLATAVVLALALAALLTRWWRARQRLAALALVLVAALGCWFAPFATDPTGDPSEVVPVRSLAERLQTTTRLLGRVATVAERVGPAAGFDPRLFAFSPNEVLLARYLGDRYGRDSPCLLFLVPPEDRWKDQDAHGFFDWGYQYHFFPLARTFSDPATVQPRPECDAPPVLVIHRDVTKNRDPFSDPRLASLRQPGRVLQIGRYVVQGP